ncbi:MAG: sigma-70 family RNA polymerase sigma factor [Planctomycetota bacterium]|jgi:RNA polymerase sigma factor for flagellar operon FliA
MPPSTRRAAAHRRPKAKTGRLDRDQLVEEYLPLVRHVVSRIAANLPAHVDTDELFQVGSVGLVNASRSFDTSRGVAFKTYAFALIRGAVLDELRRLDLVPRSTREKIRAMETCSLKLSHELGRPPAPVEIAGALGVPQSTVDDLIRSARAVMMLSLDDGTGSPDALLVRDILPCGRSVDPGDAAAKAELIEDVASRIRELPETERRVITMYYREGLLLREIGVILGVTESRVSQIHSRALRWLREMLLDVG